MNNVGAYLAGEEKKLNTKAGSTISNVYRPEIEATNELQPVGYTYYQLLVGTLWWIVELGRVDIYVEVLMISSCLTMPIEGHLQQLFHIFAYLNNHHNTEMVFDPSATDFGADKSQRQYWSYTVYGDAPPDRPPNMPNHRGQVLIVSAYVDNDHAGDTVTRISKTGFYIYCNNALVYWMSKKQVSIETSSFESEFVAIKACTK